MDAVSILSRTLFNVTIHFKHYEDLAKPSGERQAGRTQPSDTFFNWQSSKGGRVEVARGSRGERIRLAYDTRGRAIERKVERNGFRPQRYVFTWDGRDRLVAALTPQGHKWTYAYDALGRRLARVQHARAANDKNDKDGHIGEWREIGRADYLWDGDVILKESLSNDTGEIVRETAWHFEPDSFVPLAREEAGHLSYVVTDHLGTPRELISEAGELVWAAEYTTWGEVRRLWQAENDDDGPPGSGGFQGYGADGQPVYGTRPGSSPRGDPGGGGGGGLVSGNLALKASDDPDPYHCPIRFQGQWADAETGLYDNRSRYYDARAA